jgi:hypothetical protein
MRRSESCRVVGGSFRSRHAGNSEREEMGDGRWSYRLLRLPMMMRWITQHAHTGARCELARSILQLHATIAVCTGCMRDGWCEGGGGLVELNGC